MSLYTEWKDILESEATSQNFNQNFFTDYYNKEKEVYQEILENKENYLEDTIENLADRFNLKPYEMMGFIDGIETSLNNTIENIEELEAESNVILDINFEKLLYNMHLNKASWLYELEEWDGIFDKEKQKEIEDKYHYGRTVRKGKKIGRNEPCPCGSGKKYKNCCGRRKVS